MNPSKVRRRGDDYQDIIALWLALKHYEVGQNFKMYLEYESKKVGIFDDIFIEKKNQVIGYQVKHSENNIDNYGLREDKSGPQTWSTFENSNPVNSIFHT